MATGVTRTPSFTLPADEVKEEVTCPVCLEIFVPPWIPKSLECVHVLCVLCILQIVEGGRPSFQCPQCRKVTKLPHDGPHALRTNLNVKNMAEIYQKGQSMTAEMRPKACENHENEIKNLVCKTCKLLICSFCLEETHQGHVIKAIRTFRKQCLNEKEEVGQKLEQKEARLSMVANRLAKMEEKVQQAMKIEKDKLHKHVEAIVERLRAKESELLSELHETTKKDNFDQIRDERKRVATLMAKLEENRASKTDLPESFSDEEIFNEEIQLATMRSLLDERETENQASIDLNIVQFHGRDIPDIDVGTFKKMGKFQLLTKFGSFSNPRSIAVTSTGLIVVLNWEVTTASLQIFELSRRDNAYNLKQTMKIEEYDGDSKSGNPVDIAVASMDRYFIACGTCVDVFSPVGQYKQQSMWVPKPAKPFLRRSMRKPKRDQPVSFRGPKPKHTSKAHSLAVTKDDKLIVGTFHEKSESIITIFNPDGSVSKGPIQIPIENFKPMHLATNDAQVFMSDSESKVCAMDLDTREVIIKTIPSPKGLCYDDSSSTILVTSGGKDGAVNQFCSKTGQWLGQVVSGLKWPLDICMVSEDNIVVLDMATANVFSLNKV